jgi:hypothetical protein
MGRHEKAPLAGGAFLCVMLTHRRLRYLTRWPRRLAWAFAILLLLAAVWRSWRVYHPEPLIPVETRLA